MNYKDFFRKLFTIGACITLFGCAASGVSSTATGAYYENSAAAEAVTSEDYGFKEDSFSVAEEESTIGNQEKLVYRGSLSVETLQYEDSLKTLREQIEKYHGIVEYEEEYNNEHNWYYSDYQKTRGTRNLSMTVRIPTESFQAFMNAGDGMGKVLSRSTNVENITRRYSTTATEIESLEIQQKRLLELLENANTIEEMLAIESRLSEVESSLRIHKNDLNSMDTDIAYSTIHITLSEVMTYTPQQEGLVISRFFERAWETIQWTGTFFIYLLQQIILWAIRLIPIVVLVALGVWLYRFYRKKHPKDANQEKKSIFSKKKE
ncbi:MAG: DUF4349 domain-containing protein [Solobacterium sp.]|nr:DUF4349 domain-containing protein [Solobacterium sp.]